MTDTQTADEQINSLFIRRERLESEKQEKADDIKELNAEIKSLGHDLKAFNIVIARRKRDRDDVANEDAMVELYEAELEGK
tara:strand:+ start:68 stop:310 length:243 start_codon:yes stop_codon:yes gene_type:complete